MSKITKKARDKKNVEHQRYISRITKTLYYGKFPKPDGLSLPVTELAAELFSEAQRGRSLDRLHYDDAATISRNACVSPCSLVIAILYLERLKKTCPEYLERTASSDLFLVSLMVSCKFLYDDGETDEVFINEWAASGGTTVKQLVQLEKNFLKAIKWEVFVNQPTFWKKLKDIEKIVAKKQGILRGFFTYTELETLLASLELQNLVQSVIALSVILIASYTAALFALFGSVFVVSHIPGTYLQTKGIADVEQNMSIPMVCEKSAGAVFEEEALISEFDIPKNNNLRSEVKTANALKTSIFLVSIESFLTPFCNKSDATDTTENENVQNVSWDWWTIPTLKWLSETAAYIETFETPKFDFHNSFFNFYESFVTFKFLDLEDQIHKSTKVRIQDQLEGSWHAEWTDTIKPGFYNRYLHYVQNLKS